jgi:hypothetical protein
VMDFDFSSEIRRLTNIQRSLMGIRDWNTAAESQYATAQHIADRQPITIPDFTCDEDLIQAGIVKELRPAMKELMSCFQSGMNGRQEDLLKACAGLERAMYLLWQDAE